jgi:ubiquitin-conjugating enzyme E2 variant
MRAAEWTALTLWLGFAVVVGAGLAMRAPDAPLIVATAGMFAWIGGDFGSGVAHWACDTWGSTATPLIGRFLLRSFREHHVDPEAITRHDFVEVNGGSCMVALPLLLVAAAIDAEEGGALFVAALLFFLSVTVVLTNVFHRWAHAAEPPAFARWLQRRGLVLSPEHHARHHVAPHARAYCITTGWMNPLLDGVEFWRRAESVVIGLTGAVNRREEHAAAASGR